MLFIKETEEAIVKQMEDFVKFQEQQDEQSETLIKKLEALKSETPSCPDLCREWNAAINACINVVKQETMKG